jgi:hypothetical protein
MLLLHFQNFLRFFSLNIPFGRLDFGRKQYFKIFHYVVRHTSRRNCTYPYATEKGKVFVTLGYE